jgi:AP-2 complex subunit beta-1
MDEVDPSSPLPGVPSQEATDTSAVDASKSNVANASQGSLGVEESPTDYEPSNTDPYSNLDGAFGNYVADEPRPMQDVRQSGIDDDLLV